MAQANLRIRRVFVSVATAFLLSAGIWFAYAERQYFMQDERNGSITTLGQMNVRRAAHSATLLANGQVLILGGMERAEGAELNTASAELYDPQRNLFKPAGQMIQRRAGHTATLLRNGDVLITGGFDEGLALASAEIYHPTSGTFVAIGDMAVRRDRHSATLLEDGSVLITGGNPDMGTAAHATAELFEPETSNIVMVGNMTAARSAHAATLLKDGSVLLTGGSAKRFDNVLATAEVYDPNQRTFTAVKNMNAPRHKHAAALLPNGKVLIMGGSDDARGMGGRENIAELYDPQLQTFSLTGTMVKARFKITMAVVALKDGHVVVAGDGPYVEVYDPGRGDYRTAKGGMQDGWMYSSAVLLSDGSVFIAGGYNEDMAITAVAWLYRSR